MKRLYFCAIAIAIVFGSLFASATTYTVVNTNDAGAGSLRAAVTSATNGDVINFNISSSANYPTIFLKSELQISKNITIDGSTQANFTIINPTVVIVGILGTDTTKGNIGFHFFSGASGSTVKGLRLLRFIQSPLLIDPNFKNGTFVNNFIGIDTTGVDAAENGQVPGRSAR